MCLYNTVRSAYLFICLFVSIDLNLLINDSCQSNFHHLFTYDMQCVYIQKCIKTLYEPSQSSLFGIFIEHQKFDSRLLFFFLTSISLSFVNKCLHRIIWPDDRCRHNMVYMRISAYHQTSTLVSFVCSSVFYIYNAYWFNIFFFVSH